MSQWLKALQSLGARGADAVLVTMVSGKGSTPREAGSKMVVTPDGLHGSIGGGEVEFQATRMAREMLGAEQSMQSRRFALGASFGQHCGGAADLLFERVPAGAEWVGVLAGWFDGGHSAVMVTRSGESAELPGKLLVREQVCHGSLGNAERDAEATDAARRLLDDREAGVMLADLADGTAAIFERVAPGDFDIVLFGAGHVGRALCRVLGVVAARITWIDSRANEFPAEVPDNVRVVVTQAPQREVAQANPGSYFLVMTHSHALDLELVELVLRRGDAAFCGMIGSQTKRRSFERALEKRDLPSGALERFACPIGIPGIQDKDPGAIAVAVVAQLLERREATLRPAAATGK